VIMSSVRAIRVSDSRNRWTGMRSMNGDATVIAEDAAGYRPPGI